MYSHTYYSTHVFFACVVSVSVFLVCVYIHCVPMIYIVYSISDVLGRVDIKWTESEHRTHTLVQCLSCASDLENIDTSTLLSPSQQLQRYTLACILCMLLLLYSMYIHVLLCCSVMYSSMLLLFRCRETVLERESKMKDLAGQVLGVQDMISQVRRQITSAEERLPQLEEAKKTAVAGK